MDEKPNSKCEGCAFEKENVTMRKIINPCMARGYTSSGIEVMKDAFVKIEYNEGRLSLSGVVGPLPSGNCYGSAGQCYESIAEGKVKEGWTQEMLDKLVEIWKEWHLNDMRPYCEHQKKLGWRELAKKEVTLYHYTLTTEAYNKKRDAEEAALTALREGRTFIPTDEQIKFATMPHGVTTHAELEGEDAKWYEPKKRLYPGSDGATEKKTLGWLYEKDHPDGILSKPCPVCGYRYGTAWLKEEVPQDVIDWLFALPDTKVQPAWV